GAASGSRRFPVRRDKESDMAKSDNPARAQAAANTRKLIEWAVEAVGKPLPEPVRRRAAIILSDDIGAMVAGSLETQVARAREGLLRTSSGKVEATVLAKGAPRADRYAAASANGMSITWCELDEGFRNASCRDRAGEHVIGRTVRYGSRRRAHPQRVDLRRRLDRPACRRLGRGRDRWQRGHAVRRLRRRIQLPRAPRSPRRRPGRYVVGH